MGQDLGILLPQTLKKQQFSNWKYQIHLRTQALCAVVIKPKVTKTNFESAHLIQIVLFVKVIKYGDNKVQDALAEKLYC